MAQIHVLGAPGCGSCGGYGDATVDTGSTNWMAWAALGAAVYFGVLVPAMGLAAPKIMGLSGGRRKMRKRPARRHGRHKRYYYKG